GFQRNSCVAHGADTAVQERLACPPRSRPAATLPWWRQLLAPLWGWPTLTRPALDRRLSIQPRVLPQSCHEVDAAWVRRTGNDQRTHHAGDRVGTVEDLQILARTGFIVLPGHLDQQFALGAEDDGRPLLSGRQLRLAKVEAASDR